MTDFFSVSDNDFGFRNTEIQQIYVRNKNGANVYWFNRKKQFHILNVFIDFFSFDKLIMKSSNSKTNDMFGWIILSNINE